MKSRVLSPIEQIGEDPVDTVSLPSTVDRSRAFGYLAAPLVEETQTAVVAMVRPDRPLRSLTTGILEAQTDANMDSSTHTWADARNGNHHDQTSDSLLGSSGGRS